MYPPSMSPRPVSPHFGLKQSAGFYPNKPNAFVMSTAEKSAAAMAKLAHVKFDLDDATLLEPDGSNPQETSRQRLVRYFESGDSLILTPNHSTPLDVVAVGLMSNQTGHRTARMAAKELFENNRLLGKLLQANNTFSVDRGIDASKSIEKAEEIVAGGESLLMFPQGHINWKRHKAELEEFKPGAANIAIGATQRAGKNGSAPNVKLVPLTFLFEPKGDRRVIEAAMDKAIQVLEKKHQKLLKLDAQPTGTVKERLNTLFQQMVEEREAHYNAIYEKRYKALNGEQSQFLKASGSDYYGRLDNLQKQILELLEHEYLGAVSSGQIAMGSFERRARKLKGAIFTQQAEKRKQLQGKDPGALNAWNKQAAKDKKTLQDIIIGLSMYKKDYLNDDIGRQIEFMARLAHDIQGRMYSFRKMLKFLRRANVEIKVVVGKAIDVNQAVAARTADNPQLFQAEATRDSARKKLSLDLTAQIQEQIQGTMNKAVASKKP